VKSLQTLIAEASQLENFVAKKFKKGPEFVLPMTVTADGGDDIPPPRITRQFMAASIEEFRDARAFGPLALPSLRVRRVRNPPRAFVAPRQKKDEDF
jgi:hypothetical protein